jgi:ferrous iron transport protein B
VALAGNPNVGKTTLFNALTGLNQRTGNYPGVTVSWHVGQWELPDGGAELVDLPGSYSLTALSPDEALVQKLLQGLEGPAPSALLAIIDASNPERNLYFLSQLLDLGLPTVVALNMGDVAESKGLKVDAQALSKSLGLRVVAVRAHKKDGIQALAEAMEETVREAKPAQGPGLPLTGPAAADPATIRGRYEWARNKLVDVITRSEVGVRFSDRVDKVLTHRVWGVVALVLVMGMIFQSIYSWSNPLMDLLDKFVSWGGALILKPLAPGILKDLLSDGVIAGVGSILIFVPQIAVLFFFIAILEDCGYMARSAFLMDRLFAKLGLSGRSFIPLLSSFACAVPGILATRTIADRKERLTTMLVAPLMSCSARLPVYTVLIAAFLPGRLIFGVIDQRALVLLALYCLGLAVAVPVAYLLRKRMRAGVAPLFLIELPSYKWPDLHTVLRRVTEQCKEFVANAGTIILAVAVVVWALGAFPRPQALLDGFQARRQAVAAEAAPAPVKAAQGEALDREQQGELMRQSWLGRLGRAINPVFEPLGWDWRVTMAALASIPAREVVIGSMGTIFSATGGDADSGGLRKALVQARRDDGTPVFTIAVALSLMVFFALCAQCASTLAVIRRESGHWGWAAFTFSYMTILAWGAGAIVFHVAAAFGLG